MGAKIRNTVWAANPVIWHCDLGRPMLVASNVNILAISFIVVAKVLQGKRSNSHSGQNRFFWGVEYANAD